VDESLAYVLQQHLSVNDFANVVYYLSLILATLATTIYVCWWSSFL